MSRFMEEFTKACNATNASYRGSVAGMLLRYVAQGDKAALQQVKKQVGNSRWFLYWLDDVWKYLASPDNLSEEEKRAMHAAIVLGHGEITEWLKSKLEKNPPDEEAYLDVFVKASGTGKAARTEAAAAIIDLEGDWLQRPDGKPNAAGRFLLSLSDAELAAAGKKATFVTDALRFLLGHVPQRVRAVAPVFLLKGGEIFERCCRILLEHNAKTYEPIVAKAIGERKKVVERAPALAVLAAHFPKKWLTAAKEANLEVLSISPRNVSFHDETTAFKWLVSQFGAKILPELETYLSSRGYHQAVMHNLRTLADELGETAAPGVIAATRHPGHEIRLESLPILIGWDNSAYDATIRSVLENGLGSGDTNYLVDYIGLAGRWHTELLAEPLWKLFENRSKPVRAAAARALGRLGDEAVTRAIGLLDAKKASVRSGAVTLLATAQTPAAARALEARLDDETDEEIRDQMLLALDAVWQSQGKKITRREINHRIERTAPKLTKPVASWLDEKKLPPLYYATKKSEKLSPQAVRYLLYRQSRAKEMRSDIECKPFYAMIDRKRSGDFAMVLTQLFARGKMAADDRWALAAAGLLGDDRLVPVFMQLIRQWVDGKRGKMAEYAAQALALLGTDAALCAVDSLSIRYRSKQKNIGKAAAEAFAEAAERLGMTADELGDRVVPWLGFEPGKPRMIVHGDKQIEVRIGQNFKLEFRDVIKGKKIASLPKAIPAEVKSEFTDLAATLREVIKGQLARLENLMVRQFRWPLDRWRELFLAHPVLFPFATRMVWGLYSSDGRLLTAFRALEDRTLSNEQDEAVELPDGGAADHSIGIVHPLELSPPERQAWATHLADYDVQSPFLQMERPVVFPSAEEKSVKICGKYNGTELNGMTFKGRAERLGWIRGSVCDGGCITFYCKTFPGAGADALIALDGMFIGIDMYDDITLQEFYFVRSGSVSFGGYEYDEPRNSQDPRMLAFGDVPPIVFSETMGDLTKIAGRKEDEDSP